MDQYVCVTAGLGRIHHSSFAIELEPPGFFDRAGVFFAGVRLSPELVRLQEHVVAVVELCGFEPDRRPYHPHITLARDTGSRQGLRRLKTRLKTRIGQQRAFSSFVANGFQLYESFPDPGGSRYEVRERFPLIDSSCPR